MARTPGNAADHPQLVAAGQRADCSVDLHRAATLLELDARVRDEARLAFTAYFRRSPTHGALRRQTQTHGWSVSSAGAL